MLWWTNLYSFKNVDRYYLADLPVIKLKDRGNDEKLGSKKDGIQLWAARYDIDSEKPGICVEDEEYSENMCNIVAAWDNRIEELKRFFKDRFDCILPGVITSLSFPICTRMNGFELDHGFDSLVLKWNTTDKLGYDSLMQRGYEFPSLAGLPLATSSRENEKCAPRCRKNT